MLKPNTARLFLQDFLAERNKCWMAHVFVNKNTVWEFGGLYSTLNRKECRCCLKELGINQSKRQFRMVSRREK